MHDSREPICAAGSICEQFILPLTKRERRRSLLGVVSKHRYLMDGELCHVQ